MSLVGPRTFSYGLCLGEPSRMEIAFAKRLSAMPGVTGLWRERGRKRDSLSDIP